jgi:putative membrane protein (TIGR04086 family)
MSIAKVIIPLFSLALGGFIMGKNANKNGWLEGAKIGLIIILLIAIGNLIFNQGINTKDFIFYALLLISAIFGSMFGINMKKETK